MSPNGQARAGRLLAAAREAEGFMPEAEGRALTRLAARAARSRLGPLVEIGAYCGRSTLFLAAGLAEVADRRPEAVLLSVDHHRGSEELQAGWPHHDPTLVDPATGRMDSLPRWRRTVEAAGAEDLVVAVVGDSPTVAAVLARPLALVFVDGGHGEAVVAADYRAWAPLVAPGGRLAFHDVFADPADGGQGPYRCYEAALASGRFVAADGESAGCLRVLEALATDGGAARGGS